MYRRCVPPQVARHPNWGHPDHDACGTGFVARLGGPASHEIINISLTALERLTHRGGVDADGASGDGAGLLTSLPHEFFRAARERAGELICPKYLVWGLRFSVSSAAAARAAVEAAADIERLRMWLAPRPSQHQLSGVALSKRCRRFGSSSSPLSQIARRCPL
jgi:glutamate synthase domain-containing protein 1